METIRKIWYSTSEVARITGIKSHRVRWLAHKNPDKIRISMAGYYKFHYKFVEHLKEINL